MSAKKLWWMNVEIFGKLHTSHRLKSAAFEVYLCKFVNVELSILRITTGNYSNYQS